MRPQATIRPLSVADEKLATPVARRRTLQAVRNQGSQQLEVEASPLRDALLRYLESLP